MAISTLTATAGGIYGKTVYIVDTSAEITDLPTGRTPGSIAKVIDTQEIYMLSNDNKWEKYMPKSGSDCVEVSDEWVHGLFNEE